MKDLRPSITLKPGREKSLLRRHPWVFSGAIEEVKGNPDPGKTVDVFTSSGDYIACGAYSHQSQISIRIWTWEKQAIINEEFLLYRINRAISRRKGLLSSKITNAVRLIHAESDRMPGLIVDQYDDILVIQLLSWGVEIWKEEIASILKKLTNARFIFERSDVEARNIEGLPKRSGIVLGVDGSEEFEINENGVRFLVDVEKGHKTGFYLDQRKNRNIVRNYVEGKEVLDCFSFSGGFTVNALLGGAEKVTAVDESQTALSLLTRNLALNNLNQDNVELIQEDVFKYLRKLRDRDRKFDLIILDPPKFAPTRSQVNRASRGYKDINLLAFKLLRPGGILFTFSCSGGINADLFQKIVAGAALDAGVDVQIIEKLSQDSDHPIALNFPEGAYLKGLVCRTNV